MIKKMLLKYIFVGVTNTFITLIISFICLKLMFSYQSSYSIGFFAGFINSMIMNNLYTFKDKRKKLNIKYILKFTFYFLLSFFVSKVSLYLLIEELYISVYLSIMAAMGVYTAISYLLFKRFVYK
jgi:putative flippase GtrA